MPAVLVLGEEVALFVRVAHDVGADLLDHTDETRAAGPAIEPKCQGCGRWVTHVGLDEHVVDLASGFCGVEVAGVDGGADHSLSGWESTGGEETRSSAGSEATRTAAKSSNRACLIIYLSIIYPT